MASFAGDMGEPLEFGARDNEGEEENLGSANSVWEETTDGPREGAAVAGQEETRERES